MSGADVGRSTDSCATWTNTGNPRPAEYVFADGDSIWATVDTGLEKWSGSQWQTVPTPLDGNRFIWMGKTSSGRYVIGTFSQGMMLSTDSVTWMAPGLTGFSSATVGQIAGGPSHMYAITQGSPHNIACSDGTGTTWASCNPLGGLALTVDPNNDAHVIAAIYDDLGETTSSFASLTNNLRELTMDAAIVEDIDYLPTGELLAATDRGIFIAPAGTVAFQPRLTGLDAWDIDQIFRSGDELWLATRGGPLVSSGGTAFQARTQGVGGNTTIRHIRAMPDGRVIAGGRNLYVTSDAGMTWTTLQTMGSADAFFVADIAFDGTRMFIATGARLLYSDPPYATSTATAFPGGPYPGDVMLLSGTRLWIGTDRGLRFSDGGASIFSATDIGNRLVRDLLELPDGRLVVATLDGVWISNTTKSTFARAGLDGIYVDGLTLVDTTLIAATAVGVRYSRDAGTTWTPLPGAENTACSATLLDDTTGQLLVGTDERGLIRVPLPP
jgi:ligand-binding sensor domain-containing protein